MNVVVATCLFFYFLFGNLYERAFTRINGKLHATNAA